MMTDDQCAALINQALSELQKGNPQRAWLLLQAARDGGCRQAELHIGFGALYEGMGELAKACAAFDYAVRVDPNLAQAYNNRGRSYLRLDCLAEAMAMTDFQQAIALQPENARAHYNVGGVLAQQGRFAEALQSFQRAAALHYAPALQAVDAMQTQLAAAVSHKPQSVSPRAPESELQLIRAMITLATFAYATIGPDRRLAVVETNRFFGLGSKQQVNQQTLWIVTIEELHEFDKQGYNASPRGATLEIAQTPPFLLRVTSQQADACELSLWREQQVAGTKKQAFKKMREHVYQINESELAQALQDLLANGVLTRHEETLTYLG